jgi:hypothetical protein
VSVLDPPCSTPTSESLHAEMHICLTESILRFSMTKWAMNRTAVDFVEFRTRGRIFCLYIFHFVNALRTVPSLYRRWCLRSGESMIRTNTRISSSLYSLNNEALWGASMIAYRFHSDSLRLMFWLHRHEHPSRTKRWQPLIWSRVTIIFSWRYCKVDKWSYEIIHDTALGPRMRTVS